MSLTCLFLSALVSLAIGQAGSDTPSQHSDHGVRIITFSNTSLESCARSCLEDSTLQCQYFKFVDSTGRCYLSAKDATKLNPTKVVNEHISVESKHPGQVSVSLHKSPSHKSDVDIDFKSRLEFHQELLNQLSRIKDFLTNKSDSGAIHEVKPPIANPLKVIQEAKRHISIINKKLAHLHEHARQLTHQWEDRKKSDSLHPAIHLIGHSVDHLASHTKRIREANTRIWKKVVQMMTFLRSKLKNGGEVARSMYSHVRDALIISLKKIRAVTVRMKWMEKMLRLAMKNNGMSRKVMFSAVTRMRNMEEYTKRLKKFITKVATTVMASNKLPNKKIAELTNHISDIERFEKRVNVDSKATKKFIVALAGGVAKVRREEQAMMRKFDEEESKLESEIGHLERENKIVKASSSKIAHKDDFRFRKTTEFSRGMLKKMSKYMSKEKANEAGLDHQKRKLNTSYRWMKNQLRHVNSKFKHELSKEKKYVKNRLARTEMKGNSPNQVSPELLLLIENEEGKSQSRIKKVKRVARLLLGKVAQLDRRLKSKEKVQAMSMSSNDQKYSKLTAYSYQASKQYVALLKLIYKHFHSAFAMCRYRKRLNGLSQLRRVKRIISWMQERLQQQNAIYKFAVQMKKAKRLFLNIRHSLYYCRIKETRSAKRRNNKNESSIRKFVRHVKRYLQKVRKKSLNSLLGRIRLYTRTGRSLNKSLRYKQSSKRKKIKRLYGKIRKLILSRFRSISKSLPNSRNGAGQNKHAINLYISAGNKVSRDKNVVKPFRKRRRQNQKLSERKEGWKRKWKLAARRRKRKQAARRRKRKRKRKRIARRRKRKMKTRRRKRKRKRKRINRKRKRKLKNGRRKRKRKKKQAAKRRKRKKAARRRKRKKAAKKRKRKQAARRRKRKRKQAARRRKQKKAAKKRKRKQATRRRKRKRKQAARRRKQKKAAKRRKRKKAAQRRKRKKAAKRRKRKKAAQRRKRKKAARKRKRKKAARRRKRKKRKKRKRRGKKCKRGKNRRGKKCQRGKKRRGKKCKRGRKNRGKKCQRGKKRRGKKCKKGKKNRGKKCQKGKKRRGKKCQRGKKGRGKKCQRGKKRRGKKSKRPGRRKPGRGRRKQRKKSRKPGRRKTDRGRRKQRGRKGKKSKTPGRRKSGRGRRKQRGRKVKKSRKPDRRKRGRGRPKQSRSGGKKSRKPGQQILKLLKLGGGQNRKLKGRKGGRRIKTLTKGKGGQQIQKLKRKGVQQIKKKRRKKGRRRNKKLTKRKGGQKIRKLKRKGGQKGGKQIRKSKRKGGRKMKKSKRKGGRKMKKSKRKGGRKMKKSKRKGGRKMKKSKRKGGRKMKKSKRKGRRRIKKT